MDFPPGFMDQILKYQKSPPSSRTKERRIDLEIFSGLFDEVTKSMPVKDFMNKLMYCNNDDEKIDLIKPFFKWTPDSSLPTQFKKSSEMCLYFCNMAKEAPTMTESMKMLNMMFAFAADEGDLALANLMRFLYLSKGNDFIGALEAIKNVVKSPVPPKSHSLFQPPSREGVIAMETAAEKKVKESSSIKIAEKSGAYKKDIEERKEFMKNLFTLKNPNPVAPSLEGFVEIKYNSSKGRHLIVNKDVPMGTTVLVESPAVAAPYYEPFNLKIMHCHHCLKKIFHLIPCPGCVFALFCDEKCMKEAKKYHQYECSAFPDLHSIVMGFYSTFVSDGSKMPANWIAVFKLISSLGSNRLFEIFQQEEKKKQNDSSKSKDSNEIPGFDPVTKIYDPNSYETLCHLHHYFIKGSLFPSVAALCLVKILEMKSNFFDKLDIDSETKLEFQDFLTKRMLYHFESFRRNSFANDEVGSFEAIRLEDTKRKKNPVELPEISTQELGQVIYPTASLFSHSCHPNIERFNTLSHGEGAFVTLRSLKKGEKLCVSYGPHYSTEGKEGRQETLNFYNFACDCVACTENWPTADEQSMMMMVQRILKPFCPPFCCPRCYNDLKTKGEGNAVVEMKKRKMDWSKISLTPENGFKCASCNKKYSQASLFSEYNGHEVNRMKIKSLLSKNKPLEALDLVKNACDFYDRNVIPPDMYAGVVDTFQKSVLNIIHFSAEY